MSDLNLGPTEPGIRMKPVVIAFVMLALLALGIFYLNPRKTAELQVTDVHTYTFTGKPQEAKGSGNIIGGPAVVERDLYVIATLHIDNKLRLPLFLNGVDATYTAADGSEQPAHASTIADISRLEQIFPDIKPMLPHPLDITNAIGSKSVGQGQVLIEFPGFSEDIWKQRKSATLTVNFTHQTPMTIAIP